MSSIQHTRFLPVCWGIMMGLVIAVFTTRGAFADPPLVSDITDISPVYLALTAEDAGANYAVRVVSKSGDLTHIGVMGEEDFDLNVIENSPYSVVNCWVYFDGVVQTGTTVTLTTNSYRQHYGCVVVEFSDSSFDYAGFIVHPAWLPEDETHVATLNIYPPVPAINMGWPSELISVITDISVIDPTGPNETKLFKGCGVGADNKRRCLDAVKPDYPECSMDTQCSHPA